MASISKTLIKYLPGSTDLGWSLSVATSFVLTVWFLTGGTGVGTTPDSSSYLSASENLREGDGYNSHYGFASSHFPPLYSALVSATSIVTFRDVRHGAPRLLSAVLFGALGFLTFSILRLCGSTSSHAALGCLMVATQPAIAEHAATALSEIPFLVFSAMGWMWLSCWFVTRYRLSIVFCAVAFALACLTRYIGVVWPCVASLLLLFDTSGGYVHQRILRAVKFTSVSLGPLFLWLLFFDGPAGGRAIAWHPVDFERISQGFHSLAKSVGLESPVIGALIFVLILAIPIGSVARHCLGKSPPDPKGNSCIRDPFKLPSILCFNALAYFAFLVLSISLIDRATPLDTRILLPVIWMVPVLVIAVLGSLPDLLRPIRAAGFFVLFILCIAQVLWDWTPVAASWNRDGLGLSHVSVRYDRILGKLRKHPDLRGATPRTMTYSNVPWTIYLTSGIHARALPAREDYTSGRPNLEFDRALDEIVSKVKRGEALVVMDTQYTDPYFLPPSHEFFIEADIAQIPERQEGDRFLIFGSPGSPDVTPGGPSDSADHRSHQ